MCVKKNIFHSIPCSGLKVIDTAMVWVKIIMNVRTIKVIKSK